MYEKVWFEQLSALYRKDRVMQFWPSKYHSKAEKINAFSRFVLYAGILISIYHKSYDALTISIIILLAMFLLLNNKNMKPVYNKNLRHYNPNGTVLYDDNCQKPTVENPFGNVLLGDPVDRNHACPIDDVKQEISNTFNSGFVKSRFDIYDNQNSQRQFYTTPNTLTPNDQTGFATWLYGNQNVCKSEQKACIGFGGL